MAIGLLAKKIGMAQLFNEHGRAVAVTVLEAGPCTVTQVKTKEKDGYEAVQLGFEPLAQKKVTKAHFGHVKKAGATGFRHLSEWRVEKPEYTPGQQVTVEVFKEGELVDVRGTSIGKGFQGGVRRFHWKGGPATHGSMSHRSPGSIGSTTTPGRVLRGHPLPGHMGNRRITVQNLRIMKVDAQQNLLVVQGAIPGPENRLVLVNQSVKFPGKVVAAKSITKVVLSDEDQKAAKAAAKKAATKK